MHDKNQPENTITINELIKKHSFTVGAELGVRRGDFTEYLCRNNMSLNMIAVDLWDTHETINENHEHLYNYNVCMRKFQPYLNRIQIIKKLTTEAAQDIANNSIDFVFIDATHTEDALTQDIKAWLPKIKPNGIISGHDYHPHWDGGRLKQCIDRIFPDRVVDNWTCWYSYIKNINI